MLRPVFNPGKHTSYQIYYFLFDLKVPDCPRRAPFSSRGRGSRVLSSSLRAHHYRCSAAVTPLHIHRGLSCDGAHSCTLPFPTPGSVPAGTPPTTTTPIFQAQTISSTSCQPHLPTSLLILQTMSVRCDPTLSLRRVLAGAL